MQGTSVGRGEAIQVPSAGVARGVIGVLLQRNFVRGIEGRRRDHGFFLILALQREEGEGKPCEAILGLGQVDQPNLQVCSGCRQVPEVLNKVKVMVLSASQKVVASQRTQVRKVNKRVLYCV